MGQQRNGRDAATIPPGREYLSLREFANYVGIPFKTLEGWKAKGYLPRHYVFGKRHHKWKRSEIDAWVHTYGHGGDDEGEGRLMHSSQPDGKRKRTKGKIHPNYRETVKFLDAWAPEGPWVLTAIDPDRSGIETETFRPGQDDELLAWLNKQGEARNLYFTVNPVTRDLDNKPSREHIAALAWLHVDLDPRAGEDIDNEQVRIRALLGKPTMKGLPRPTCVIFSGGGYQGFWKLKEPLRLDGSVEEYEEAKLFNKQVEILLGGDNCHNVDRIMRLPGSVNRPDARKRAKGRKEAFARVEFWDEDRVFDLSEFEKAPESAAKPTGGGNLVVEVDAENVKPVQDLDAELPSSVPPVVKRIIACGRDELNSEPDREGWSRSEWQWWATCELARQHVKPEVVYSILMDPDWGISTSILDKGSAAQDYARRQVDRAFAVAADDPLLAEINSRHASVIVGGSSRVLRESWDPLFEHRTVEYLKKEAFKDFWNTRRVMVSAGNGKVQETPAGDWWFRHRLRRSYEEVKYAPGVELSESIYNLWQGFAVSPAAGDCGLYLAHLREIVCQGVEKHYEYLVRWMAHAVQKPNERGHVAVVLRGEKGTGKGVFVGHFGALWGRHFVQITNPDHLTKFNSLIEQASIAFLDEATRPNDKKHESILKAMTTEETVPVERKGIDVVERKNVLHLILASNDLSVVRATGDERRYFVLDVSNARRQDYAYFAAIDAQMRSGGYGALLKLLLEMDLSDFNIRRAPKTAALQDQVDRNLRPEDEWLFTLLDNGVLPNNVTRKVNGEPCLILNRAWWGESEPEYEDGLVDHARRTVPKLRNESEKALTAYLDDWGITSPEKGGRRSRVFPALPELRAAWCEKHGPREWSGGADADWAPSGEEEDDDGAFV